VGAIKLEENLSGEWFVSETKYGPFVHAKLGIAEENSGKLVSVVRQKAKEIAEKENLDYIIIDGPPGIGCPVIASLSGVDLALIVTEPTLSGIHDMERVAIVAKHFGVPTKVVINKLILIRKTLRRLKRFARKKI
jgi:MinD superfamily P-loop ATPase